MLGLAIAVALFRLCVAILVLSATPALALDNIRVSYATLSAAYMDHICAMDKGYLKVRTQCRGHSRAGRGCHSRPAFRPVSFQ
jgi:hypothetical protein